MRERKLCEGFNTSQVECRGPFQNDGTWNVILRFISIRFQMCSYGNWNFFSSGLGGCCCGFVLGGGGWPLHVRFELKHFTLQRLMGSLGLRGRASQTWSWDGNTEGDKTTTFHTHGNIECISAMRDERTLMSGMHYMSQLWKHSSTQSDQIKTFVLSCY